MYTLDKLVSKELCNISLCSIYEKPTSQSYFEKLLETKNLNWREISFYQEMFLLIEIFECFSTKFWITFSFSISYFSSIKKLHHHCAFLATMRMKRRCISSKLKILQSDYGMNFNILFLRTSIFLKSLHRAPSSDSLNRLSKTEFSINQPFTTNF